MADQQTKSEKFVVIRNKYTAIIDGVAPGATGRVEDIDARNPAMSMYADLGMVDIIESSVLVVAVTTAPPVEEPAAASPVAEPAAASGDAAADPATTRTSRRG